MKSLVDFSLEVDLTSLFGLLVIIGTLLAVPWVNTFATDPANRGFSAAVLFVQRCAVVAVQGGLIVTVLIGGRQHWGPWPSMLLVALGLDVFYGMGLLAWRQRRRHEEERHRQETTPLPWPPRMERARWPG